MLNDPVEQCGTCLLFQVLHVRFPPFVALRTVIVRKWTNFSNVYCTDVLAVGLLLHIYRVSGLRTGLRTGNPLSSMRIHTNLSG